MYILGGHHRFHSGYKFHKLSPSEKVPLCTYFIVPNKHSCIRHAHNNCCHIYLLINKHLSNNLLPLPSDFPTPRNLLPTSHPHFPSPKSLPAHSIALKKPSRYIARTLFSKSPQKINPPPFTTTLSPPSPRSFAIQRSNRCHSITFTYQIPRKRLHDPHYK